MTVRPILLGAVAATAAVLMLANSGDHVATNPGVPAEPASVILTDTGSSTASLDSAPGSAHDYTHNTAPFTTWADWTIEWWSSGQFAIIVGYLVVGRPGGDGPGSGTVHMHGAGRHRLSIVSEKAYRVVVRSAGRGESALCGVR